jgi:hexosaminidase
MGKSRNGVNLAIWQVEAQSLDLTIVARAVRIQLTNGNGTISNAILISGGNPYSLNYNLPLNVWMDVSLIEQGHTTRLVVSSKGSDMRTMELLTRIGLDGKGFAWAPIAVATPLAWVGEGFTGLMQDIASKGSAS